MTNVQWSFDDSHLVSVGGADTSVMVWTAPGYEGEDGTKVSNDDSQMDSESEEESGYDSDVDREAKRDYTSKIYTNPLREISIAKPQLKETEVVQK